MKTIKAYDKKRGMKYSFFAIFFILAAIFGTGSYAAEKTDGKITILHTNDTHSHLVPFDMPDVGKKVGGIARRYEVIKKLRAKNPELLLLDAGDIFQGTPFYTFFKGEADIAAMNLCGYDATTLGNHDLDDGLSNLLKQLEKADFPLLCGNVFYKGTNKPVFPAFKIFNRGGLKIAVIGAIGDEPWQVTPQKYTQDLFYIDAMKIISRIAAMLRKHVDVIVMLSHLGYDPDLEFAKNIKDVDIIIGGHTNTRLDAPVLVKNGAANGLGGSLVLQNFKWAAFLGQFEISFDGARKISAYKGTLWPIDSKIKTSKRSEVEKLMASYEKQIKSLTGVKIGTCAKDMLYPEEEKHLKDLPIGSFVCDVIKNSCSADMSIINSGTIREMMPGGVITTGTVMSILPFDNSLVTYDMKGSEINAIFKFIAENYSVASGYQYGGVSFTLDVKNKAARDIMIGGKPLEMDKTYKVTTISYMAEGNQNGNIFFKNAKTKSDNGFFMRDTMIEYIKNHDEIIPPEPGRMKIIN
ncbi:MAG TPA: bifunctional UDP-sugar hydrolase/5'-nucleotidase [Candidatus Wallbacteria bacterium]|nr:bifunctional UDP-sugar hydrolase/5'-nucleotidase [Candidatus Wallbacteria bacterium]